MLQRLLYDGGGESVFHVDGLHEADATRGVEEVVLRAERFEFGAAIFANGGGVLDQVFVEDGFDGGDTGGAGNRVAAEGGAVVARREEIGARSREHRANRYATGQSFCHCDDVGYDAEVFPAKEFAGASHARLYLVADHYQVLLIAQLPHALDIVAIARPDTALALHGFEQHGNRVLADGGLQRG